MNIFGMGTFEVVMILLVATLVLGPGKIPQLAKQLGNFLRAFRKMTGDMTKDFTKVIDAGNTKAPPPPNLAPNLMTSYPANKHVLNKVP